MAKKPAKAKPAKAPKPEKPKKPPKKIKVKQGKRPKLAKAPKPPKRKKHVAILKTVKRSMEAPMNNNALNVTVACPVGMVNEGNQFALTVGLTPADIETFGEHSRHTINGEDYYIANTHARLTFMYAEFADLSEDATEKGADLALAEAAQNALDVWAGDGDVPAVSPTTLVTIVQPIHRDAGKVAMGLLGAA